ncbi:type II toxin-antitoxin system RelE/ParE family toxin [Selenomonas sp.]|uniref:type II toxin-antitoxin system RelE/ParE family toxin n=1 Tax=Selenomonas sp. TaxID=2053611 RepID=UPI0025DAE189|nr:type II toxin-antitoxin system RelE/ParE family toxin [Selenomonas sp.]MCI6085183.1 type II toxin-antitoxin system RelE/ParE family toxin [Selenomonas sp.]MDY3296262.1 type II toxin-antitoxin system RelE/ParE family toxin [Selenomonas sp.]MDY4417035.1 type II toxin-antitoxin system RelE/ParE family toxin [Selenomonas sp.]
MEQDNFEIEFFEKDDATCPVQEFLDSLDDKMAAKVYGMMDVLAMAGNALRKPYSSKLNEHIFELRVKQGSNITRVLYFFFVGKHIVMTNGFAKKQQKTPPRQIEIAEKYRKIYLQRKGVNA